MNHNEDFCCGQNVYRHSQVVENLLMVAVYAAFIWACAETIAGCITP